ncbi:MAG: glycosyltransferase 87 family protein, partial [Actinomycetota bacterium]
MTATRWLPWALVGLAIVVWAVPLQIGFYTHSPITDIPVYREAADRMLDGLVPYRDFFLEYPPLAAGLFGAVGLVPGNYTAVFQVAMAACLCATVLGVLAAARALGLSVLRQAAAGAAVAVSPLLIGNLVETRFDLAVAAVLAWTLYAAVAGRFRLMWGLLAVAVLLKIVPLVLVPLLVLHQRRRQDL